MLVTPKGERVNDTHQLRKLTDIVWKNTTDISSYG